MSWRSLAGRFVVVTLIAGCGSSGRSNSVTSVSTTSARPTRASGSASPNTASATSTSTNSSRSASGSSSRSTSASSSDAIQTSASSTTASTTTGAATSSAARTQADTNVRLPAIFSIKAGGVLDPPQIAAPKRIDIELTVSSRDGKTHLFVLDTPQPYRATVHPDAPARHRLSGIPKGTYSIDIDHIKRGALIVGVAPGP